MEAGHGVTTTPHRGARPHRNWTPTRADLARIVGNNNLPNWTDPQAATLYHVRFLGFSPTQVSVTHSVTIQTVVQHLKAAIAKWEAWTPPPGTSTVPAEPPEPDLGHQWEALNRRVAEIVREREDIGAPDSPP